MTSSSATAQPTSSSAQATHLVVSATAVPSNPCRYSKVEIHVSVDDANGAGVAAAQVSSDWHYKTTTSHETGTTDAAGFVVLERGISSATAGYTVRVDVDATKDNAHGSTSTSFTPRTC